jgi:hypothetical protein
MSGSRKEVLTDALKTEIGAASVDLKTLRQPHSLSSFVASDPLPTALFSSTLDQQALCARPPR